MPRPKKKGKKPKKKFVEVKIEQAKHLPAMDANTLSVDACSSLTQAVDCCPPVCALSD